MSAPSLIPDKDKTKPKKDRVDLKLYNAIAIFDVYMVSRDGNLARESLISAIASGDVEPTEVTATEIRQQGSIRASWLEKSPYIATDVTDAEFETLKGITTSAAFDRFYTRRG
jgi:hypothetical protein